MAAQKRIIWKEGQVFSIRLKNDKYVLAQMITKHGQIAVFKNFQDKDNWENIILNKNDILFCCFLARTDLKRIAEVVHKKVEPILDLPKIDWTINSGGGSRMKTLWKGTPNEKTFILLGEGKNVLHRSYRLDGEIKEETIPISNEEYDKYKHYEPSFLRGYPEFNERLYLCSIKGENFDPLKELIFDRELDLECSTYIDIISGKVPKNELGY